MRIARTVKARWREKIEELIARAVAKTVVSKLNQQIRKENSKMFLQTN